MSVFLGEPPANVKAWIIEHYTPPTPVAEPLCFTAEEANSTVSLNTSGDWPADYNYLEVSTDGKTWTEYDGYIITLANVGDKVYFNTPEGITNHSWGNDYEFKFVMEGKIAASGNIMSLAIKDGLTDSIPEEEYYFYEIFRDCSSITSAPALPATKLEAECYDNMFDGCSSLTQAPALPATTLATDCYSYMFKDCTSLTSAPELQATKLETECYACMFDGCSSLASAPQLPATTLADSCYFSMFNYCTSLVSAPALPATTLADFCYSDMFNYCTSLVSAPALPATTLATDCYSYMFKDCIKFSDCHMKASMEGVYDSDEHGDTTKTVIYDL